MKKKPLAFSVLILNSPAQKIYQQDSPSKFWVNSQIPASTSPNWPKNTWRTRPPNGCAGIEKTECILFWFWKKLVVRLLGWCNHKVLRNWIKDSGNCYSQYPKPNSVKHNFLLSEYNTTCFQTHNVFTLCEWRQFDKSNFRRARERRNWIGGVNHWGCRIGHKTRYMAQYKKCFSLLSIEK